MRSSSPQLVKEARQLAWPWTILMLSGLAMLAGPRLGSVPFPVGYQGKDLNEAVLAIGTFFGSALLAALPLGSEFQFRTLAMRFAQPIERHDLWREKFITTLLAVVPPASIFCVAVGMRFGWPFALAAASWIAMTTAGAIPSTFLARSTMGGMMLNTWGTTGVAFAWMYYENHRRFPTFALWAMAAVVVIYTVFMVWLGRRMFLRFQAVDGMQAGEAFVPGAQLVPNVIAKWLRSHPAQPVGNLVRREFRLMRGLWPLTAFNFLAWVLLVAFHQLPTDNPDSEHVVFFLTIFLGVLIAVLAGALSLGEEKTAGTHDWHMTLPLSLSTQWGVKLLFALCAGVACSALVPMAVIVVGGWISGSPWRPLTGEAAVLMITEAAAIAFAAFWCACVVRGTVQAVLWLFPLCAAIFFAGTPLAALIGQSHGFQKVIDEFVARVDAVALAEKTDRILRNLFLTRPPLTLTLLLLTLFGVALIQSRRLFRGQTAANRLRVLRSALPLLIVAAFCGLTVETVFTIARHTWRQQSSILRDTGTAIASAMAIDPRPRSISYEELARSSQLSERTQPWLRHASITAVPATSNTVRPGIGQYFPGLLTFAVPNDKAQPRLPFSAVVRTENGTECALAYQKFKENSYQSIHWKNGGFLTAVCQ